MAQDKTHWFKSETAWNYRRKQSEWHFDPTIKDMYGIKMNFLQFKGDWQNEILVKPFDESAPFVDTAAIIENLDLVITCDTSIAHLSGAIGKKTFLLLQKNSEWRWLQDIDYSPWYNSIKIYRQKTQDDWSTVFDNVKKDIKKLIN